MFPQDVKTSERVKVCEGDGKTTTGYNALITRLQKGLIQMLLLEIKRITHLMTNSLNNGVAGSEPHCEMRLESWRGDE